ncbi:MAG: hypothetical protein KU29_06160 [Sulfurovum sp. FS06-10]|nr:MAG: hypothetical protein KU29_06160 [Sulfurovum sp. FS06-10]
MKKIKVLLIGLCLTQSLYSYEYDEKDVYHILSSTTLGYVGETLLHKSSSKVDLKLEMMVFYVPFALMVLLILI